MSAADANSAPPSDDRAALPGSRRNWRTAARYLISTVSHAVSASFIAVTAYNVAPTETRYLLLAIGTATLLDFDHLYYVLRNWQRYKVRQGGDPDNLHQSRSPLHELAGILLAGIVSAIFYLVDDRAAGIFFIAFTLHVVQDWFLSRPTPLVPVDDIEVHFFDLTQTQKAALDSAIAVTFSVLWLLYLTGRV